MQFILKQIDQIYINNLILERNNCVDPNEISNSILNLLKLDPYLKIF